MSKADVHVVVIEDDPYANDIMMMLLARDYRTHVVKEISNQVTLDLFDSPASLLLAENLTKVDVVILDTETPWNSNLPFQIAERLSTWAKPPKILCTATHPLAEAIEVFSKLNSFAGYLVKAEVLYSLASVVCLAAKGYCVITPQVCSMVEKRLGRETFPAETLVVSSGGMSKVDKELNQTGKEIFRLGIIFNLPQYDIHDELSLSEVWVAKTMSKGYLSLQIPDLVSGDTSLDDLFNNPYIDNSKILDLYQEVLENLPEYLERRHSERRNSKFRNMSTLAFHLLTIPNIQRWDK
jgi:DNA-binding NarL/FixJ family response regulator